MLETRQQVERASSDIIFVLGAGVDRILGLPLLNTLFKDLNNFVHGAGKAINTAIRAHVKHMRFDLQTYSGDEAEALGQKLLGTHTHLLPLILTALAKHPSASSPYVATVKALMVKLSTIANENELGEDLMSQVGWRNRIGR
jgi:hypothetical protein